jgi:hypothetical protein
MLQTIPMMNQLEFMNPFLELGNFGINHPEFAKSQTIFLTKPQEIVIVMSGTIPIFHN